jgi:hypothetical protein
MARPFSAAEAVQERSPERPWHDRRIVSGGPAEYQVVGEQLPEGHFAASSGRWSADQIGAVVMLAFGVALGAFLLGMLLAGS